MTMNRPTPPRLFIGLDPGQQTGLAVWDAEAERFAVLTTTTFWEAVDIVEAYPVEPKKSPMPPVFAWTGIASAYRTAGFQEVARRSPTRPIMRRTT